MLIPLAGWPAAGRRRAKNNGPKRPKFSRFSGTRLLIIITRGRFAYLPLPLSARRADSIINLPAARQRVVLLVGQTLLAATCAKLATRRRASTCLPELELVSSLLARSAAGRRQLISRVRVCAQPEPNE